MDGLEEKIFGRDKKELEALIQEAVERTSKTQLEFEKSKNIAIGSTDDDINKILIDYYNKKQGNTDVQAELSKSFVKGGMEKLQEREQEETLKEMNLPEEVDEKTKQEALEKLKSEGKSKDLTKEELQAQIYKAIYENVFQEYSNMMMQVKEKQIKEESLTVGDKEGTKLIIYERYLTRIEKASYNLNKERFSDDPRISEIRENFKEEFNEKQKQVDDVTRENIDDMNRLYNERNEIAEELEYYTINPQLSTPDQIEELLKKYREVVFKIREQDPSLQEYSRQVDLVKENQNFAEREVGEKRSSTDVDNSGIVTDSVDAKDYDSPVTKKNTQANTKDNIEDIERLEKNEEELRKEEVIKRINKAKEKGDIEEANRLIWEYRYILEGERIIVDDTPSPTSEVENDGFEYRNFIAGLGAVRTDKEMAEAIKKMTEETVENSKKIGEGVTPERTLFKK